MGFVVSLAVPLASGATVLTMPRFDLAQFFALIERHRVTVLGVPPPVMAALVRHPLAAEHDLTSLELIVSGGAPLGADLQREEAARFPHATVGQAWGMTETTVGAPCPTASWAPRRAPSGASCPPPSCASWSPTPDGTLG
jgi:acyl-CoA synthetase (AMP-forming)/AMP-acid ligase II